MSDKQQPTHKVDAYWPITGTIWANYNRKNELYFTYSLQRSYRDEQGQYKSTLSFSADHAKAVEKTNDDCWHWIMTAGRQRARQHNQSGDQQVTAVRVSPTTA